MPQRFKRKPARASGLPPRAGASASRADTARKPLVQPPPGWVTVVTCLLLALAVSVVFGQTVHYEFVNYDDNRLVFENSAITQGLSLKGVVWAFTHSNAEEWYPLTSLSHMVDWQLYGPKAGGHHLTNVLLHTATVLLLFLVLRNLTGAFWRSLLVAAVFGLHPLRVESVAWVTERKDVLSGLFFVLTLGAYARYVGVQSLKSKVQSPRPDASRFRRRASLFYLLSLFFFALGLLSKTMLVTVPFVLLLLDCWPLNRLALSTSSAQLSRLKRLLIEKVPFLLLSAAACVATLLVQARALRLVQDLSFGSQIGNALVAYAVYMGQMVYPVGLAVLYPHPGNHLSGWTVGLSGVVLSLITVGVVRWGRQRPYLVVGWLWYLGMLLPVIGIVQVGIQARADRYTYLPQLGLYLMVAWGALDLCGGWRWRRVMLASAAALMLTGLLVAAWVQTRYWRDSISLWTHTLACGSENFLAHNNLGLALAAQGKVNEAIPHYEQALELKPDCAEAHSGLGIALNQQGKLIAAIPHFERARQLNPGSAEAHNNLGAALAAQEKWSAAIPHYERALQLKPDFAEAHYNLGIALTQQGKLDEANPHYERALQLKPDYAKAHDSSGPALAARGKQNSANPHNERALQLNQGAAEAENDSGSALARQGKLDEAIPRFERALQLNPDYAEAHFNLGVALTQLGKWNAATPHFVRVLQMKPDSTEAHFNIGVALAQQGKWNEAIPHYERALQLKPDYAEAQYDLGVALIQQEKWNAAIPHFKKALELKPDFAEAQYNLGVALATQRKVPEAIQPIRRN